MNIFKRNKKVEKNDEGLINVEPNDSLSFQYMLYDCGYSIVWNFQNEKINIIIIYPKQKKKDVKEFVIEVQILKEQLSKKIFNSKLENLFCDIETVCSNNNIQYSVIDIKHFSIEDNEEELIDCLEFENGKLKKFLVTRNGRIIFLKELTTNTLYSYKQNEYSILETRKGDFDYELNLIPKVKKSTKGLEADGMRTQKIRS